MILAKDAIETALRRVESAVRDNSSLDYFQRSRDRYASDAAIASGLHEGGTVLEVGSTPGHLTALLTLLGLPVVAVDLAPERIAALCPGFALDVRRCDIEREPLPFADASVAQVVFCEVFEHLRVDPLFTLAEINRVLVPGGRMLLTTPNLYAVQQIGRFLTGRGFGDPLEEFDKLRLLGHMGHIREYSHREMRRFVHRAGFRIEQVWFKHYWYDDDMRGLAKRVIFALAPRRFHSTQVMVVRKQHLVPRLAPLR